MPPGPRAMSRAANCARAVADSRRRWLPQTTFHTRLSATVPATASATAVRAPRRWIARPGASSTAIRITTIAPGTRTGSRTGRRAILARARSAATAPRRHYQQVRQPRADLPADQRGPCTHLRPDVAQRHNQGRGERRQALAHGAGPGRAPPPRRRTRRPGAEHPRRVPGNPVAGGVRPPELQAAQGQPQPGDDRGQARLDGGLPGRRVLRARRLRRHGPDAEEGGDRRGPVADEDVGHRRGLPRRHGAGHPPAQARERRHHGQRRQPAGLRLGHQLGHPTCRAPAA